MRRTRCGGCGDDHLDVFLDLGQTPLADKFPTTPDEREPTYPLELAVCRRCRLVQLMEIVSDDVLWSDYGFYSGASPSLVKVHEQLAAQLLAQYPDKISPPYHVVEIASNDGDLLRHFRDAGCNTVGIDPAEGPSWVARQAGMPIYTVMFNREWAKVIRQDHGLAGMIIARNVVAHVTDLDDFFFGVVDLLAWNGVAIIEVQYLADLLANNQFDHVYHEHRYFFSVRTLASVLRRHGLQVMKVERTEGQGGSIRVHCIRSGFTGYTQEFDNVEDPAMLGSLQARANYVRDRLAPMLNDLRDQGLTVAGYGATAKSTTLLNFCGIGPDLLDYVEDMTPAKIGRYTPGTKIPIVAPGERPRPDVYLLLAWNYLPGILRREQKFIDGGGRFLVPIPVPVLL